MIYHIPCIEIDAPGQPLLDLWLSTLMKHLPCTSLTVSFLDLTVPAAFHPLWIFVRAFNFPHAVGAIRLPSIQKGVLTKLLTLYYFFGETDAIFLTLYWHFLTLKTLIDHGCALRRGWNISIYFLILSEGGRHDGPLDCISLKMHLILHQPIEVALFDLVELAEEILLSEHSHNLLEQ